MTSPAQDAGTESVDGATLGITALTTATRATEPLSRPDRGTYWTSRALLLTCYRILTGVEERLERVEDTRVDDTRVRSDATAASKWAERLRQPGWVLLPLRLFLGVTFTYAGLDKLSDPHFFQDASDPLSVAAQMQTFKQTSPIGPLVSIAADHPMAAGVLISLSEIAVGLATLAGLFARLAAVGGAMLSLSFLLTVSWQTRPYYYGSDIGFFVSWIPIIAVGAGGVLSLDALFHRRRRPDEKVLSRRALLQYGTAGLVLAAIGLNAMWAAVASRGSLPRKNTTGAGTASPPPATSPSAGAASPAPAAAAALAPTSEVPVGGAKLVTDPKTGQQVTVLQPSAGKFTCLSAVCTHTGCTVAWTGTLFNCPCHGSKFDAGGRVLQGPAARPLPAIPVRVEGGSVVHG